MQEKIGNITLDYTHYPGEDLYCDGAIEDDLLDIVKNNPPSEYGRIIDERAEWPILYHLSEQRENIVEWLPIGKDDKVLEVGSGCGAITGALARKAKEVVCVDLSKKRSLINAYRHQDASNVTIHVGNFKDIEPTLYKNFDYVLLIGVFEYGAGYMGTDTPYEDFFAILKKHLSITGRMIIAIENKMGLKYWAGCREDHLGTYFSGLMDYPTNAGVRTFTRGGLEDIMQKNASKTYSFYYPYPDYKFMTSIYSDAYLPKVGELTNNMRNFDRERFVLFDEKNVFDMLIREGLFPLYSNSYLLVVGEAIPVKFSKYSNDRAPEYAIRTDVRVGKNGEPYVIKIPLTEEAKLHIARIHEAYEFLCDRYEGSQLNWNVCNMEEEGLAFEYLRGYTLEELFDMLLERGNKDEFLQLFQRFFEAIAYGEEAGVTDYDLVFSNIIIQDDEWWVIDYEWTYACRIPAKEIAYRAFYCYQMGGGRRLEVTEEEILKLLNFPAEAAAEVRKKEADFQHKVTGSRMAMRTLRDKIGYPIIDVDALYKKSIAESNQVDNQLQIYEDRGTGYSEHNSYFVGDNREEDVRLELMVHSSVKQLRIDPCMTSCIVNIKEIIWNETEIPLKKLKIKTNGRSIGKTSYVFTGTDPFLTFELSKRNKEDRNSMIVHMYVKRLSEEMAEQI